MGWAPGEKERAVTRRQVILEAMSGKISWGAARPSGHGGSSLDIHRRRASATEYTLSFGE